MKAYRINDSQVAIRCPGCGHAHAIDIPRWTFNGDYDSPTFSPSLNISHPAMKDGEETDDIPAYRCHSIVTDGKIQFLGDCTHALSGKTIELPEWGRTRRSASFSRLAVYSSAPEP